MKVDNIKKHRVPDHSIAECSHKLNGVYIHKSNPKENIEHINLITKGGRKQIIVPSHNVRSYPSIWPDSEYQRLKKQAHVLTKQDKLNLVEEAQRKQENLFVESLRRKETLERSQLGQRAVPGSTLHKAETEAAERSLYVLQRAIDLRQEQEDDIKYANGVILLAKCVDIRRKQLAEKELMKKELAEEEERLNAMMEQERQKLVKLEDSKEVKKKQLNKKAFNEIVEQIEEHEYNKVLENERKKEENRLIQKRIIQMKEEDEEALRQKLLKQLQVRESLRKANEELLKIKNIQKEEQRIADCRVEEFMRIKAERDAKYQAQLAEQKAEKDRRVAILQALQEKAQGEQAASDELKAQKVQREFDREKKETERLAELKRKKVIEDLKIGRKNQIEDINRSNELRRLIENSELNKEIKGQHDLYERDLEKQRKRKEASMKYRKELLLQIRDNEIDRIQQIKQKFAEGFALKYKIEAHSIGIKNTLHKKMQRLHEKNVPECVIKDIERTLHM